MPRRHRPSTDFDSLGARKGSVGWIVTVIRCGRGRNHNKPCLGFLKFSVFLIYGIFLPKDEQKKEAISSPLRRAGLNGTNGERGRLRHDLIANANASQLQRLARKWNFPSELECHADAALRACADVCSRTSG